MTEIGRQMTDPELLFRFESDSRFLSQRAAGVFWIMSFNLKSVLIGWWDESNKEKHSQGEEAVEQVAVLPAEPYSDTSASAAPLCTLAPTQRLGADAAACVITDNPGLL